MKSAARVDARSLSQPGNGQRGVGLNVGSRGPDARPALQRGAHHRSRWVGQLELASASSCRARSIPSACRTRAGATEADQPGVVLGPLAYRPFGVRLPVCGHLGGCDGVPRRCGTVRPRSEWSIAQSESWTAAQVRLPRNPSIGLVLSTARHHARRLFGAARREHEERASPLPQEDPGLVRCASPRLRGCLPSGKPAGESFTEPGSRSAANRLAGSPRQIAPGLGRGGVARVGPSGPARGVSGNVKRARAAVMRYGCQRGEFVGGYKRRGDSRAAGQQVTASPLARSKRDEPHGRLGLQHARNRHAEQAAEVVGNHEGGTGSSGWLQATDGTILGSSREWTRGGMSTEGRM